MREDFLAILKIRGAQIQTAEERYGRLYGGRSDVVLYKRSFVCTVRYISSEYALDNVLKAMHHIDEQSETLSE